MLSFRKLRHSDHGQLLLNLCLALLGLYVAFIFSVHSSGVVVLCTIVSVVLHYFMLVVFMVMAAEAVNLYMKLVVVLGHTISHYVFKATIICWGKLMHSADKKYCIQLSTRKCITGWLFAIIIATSKLMHKNSMANKILIRNVFNIILSLCFMHFNCWDTIIPWLLCQLTRK